jgi:hypothetical protein
MLCGGATIMAMIGLGQSPPIYDVRVAFVHPSISDIVQRRRERREWDGPAALPPPKALMVRGRLVTRRSTTMPRTATVHAVTAIGIDMGKNTLHMVGFSKSSLSACNAQPVHTKGPQAEVRRVAMLSFKSTTRTAFGSN